MRPPSRYRSLAVHLAPLVGCLILQPALAGAATLHVNISGGVDGPACGSELSPCASIQQAVDLAADGDTILVAQGTYTDSENCPTGGPPGEPTVVCVQKDVTILGGYDPPTDFWSIPDPVNNVTIIDGQSTRRGVVVNRPEGGLRMEGFTIQNCSAQNGGNEFGGGMWAVLAGQGLVLRDMIFLNNEAQADSGSQAGGGGLAIQGEAGNIMVATLERVRFESNDSLGGGVTVLGSGLGGGLHADHADVTGFDIELVDNQAIGGASADGLGGGASFSFGAVVTLEKVLATGNMAIAGSSRSAFGGAIYAEGDPADADESTSVDLIDSELSDNTAQGSTTGAGGGGFLAFDASATLDRVTAAENTAIATTTSAGGGGVYFWAPTVGQHPTFAITNSVIVKNVTNGSTGGGSGLRLLGANATVSHTTVADNDLVGVGLGSGILVGPAPPSKPSDLTLDFSIVAGHAASSAVWLQQLAPTVFATGTFNRNQFTGNTSDTCNPVGPLCANTFNNIPGDNIFDGPGAATYFVDPMNCDYHIDSTSPPVDQATGSAESIDLDGADRDVNPDIGADEFGADAYRLTVRSLGAGTGTVTSDVAGINCGTDCTEIYPDSQVVNLTAMPDLGFVFGGFGGDADCLDGNVVMTADRECEASFAETVPGFIVVEKQTMPDGRSETFFFSGELIGNISDGQQLTSSALNPGTYTVTETDHPLFDLTSIVCDDGASATPSTVDLGTLTATFEVDPAETVTCTFTNTLTTCSVVDVDLVLPDETVNDTRTIQACNSITAGPYTVGATGDVTFESLEIVLRNDFTVVGDFTAIVNVP